MHKSPIFSRLPKEASFGGGSLSGGLSFAFKNAFSNPGKSYEGEKKSAESSRRTFPHRSRSKPRNECYQYLLVTSKGKILFHQIHPAKLAVDWGTTPVALCSSGIHMFVVALVVSLLRDNELRMTRSA
jgi:hypothetical protein